MTRIVVDSFGVSLRRVLRTRLPTCKPVLRMINARRAGDIFNKFGVPQRQHGRDTGQSVNIVCARALDGDAVRRWLESGGDPLRGADIHTASTSTRGHCEDLRDFPAPNVQYVHYFRESDRTILEAARLRLAWAAFLLREAGVDARGQVRTFTASVDSGRCASPLLRESLAASNPVAAGGGALARAPSSRGSSAERRTLMPGDAPAFLPASAPGGRALIPRSRLVMGDWRLGSSAKFD